MVTISKPISAGQAQAYHKEEFANAKENYYTESASVRGEWQEIKAGRLTRTPSAKVRGRVLVDLLQGVQLSAKVGITREELLEDVRSYMPLILGEQI